MKPLVAIKTLPTDIFCQALPWSYQETDPNTGERYWTGYCIDFVKKLSELMNFDYELVAPKKGSFGEKHNGKWDGVIGDLATGVRR